MEGMSGNNPTERMFQSQATFKMLRRLHGHNLESQGLNNLSENFQSFVTRAKFFSLGRLRRTWSHSAVEFMKYRRLLPMIVGDEHDQGSVFDEFLDIGPDGLPRTAHPEAGSEERRVTVSNVSAKVTRTQLQSFFNKFGKVQSCHIPTDKGRHQVGLYATMPKRKWHGICVVTFKNAQSALRARKAASDELLFYGQQMSTGPYVSSTVSRRRTTSIQNPKIADEPEQQEAPSGFTVGGQLSRTSSASSLASTGTSCSCSTIAGPFTGLLLDELPDRALQLILFYVGSLDRIRMERVNKRWLEAAATAWAECRRLDLCEEPELNHRFSSANRPFSQIQLRAILRRCGPHLRSLNFAGFRQIVDENFIRDIGTFCPNLTELDLSGIVASPEVLRTLTESTPDLKRIAYRNMGQTGERAFWFLFKGIANQLRTVDLRGSKRLRGSFFRLFGAELEELLLDGCVNLDHVVIEDICTRSNCIRTLKLDMCRRLTDESLSLISRHLSELTTLTLCGEFPLFSVEGLAQIARIDTLQHLSLEYVPLVDDSLITAIVHGCPELHQLSLAFAGTDKSITSAALINIGRLRKLESLDLSGLAALNSLVLTEICAGCTGLHRLTLRNCSYLGDDGVPLLNNLSKLEYVDLSGCILVSNESIHKLCAHFKEEAGIPSHPICLVIGGTICEPHKLRQPRNSRIVIDQRDDSSLGLRQMVGTEDEVSNDEEDDDEFRILLAHREFITDVLQVTEENFPEDERTIMEWIQREAADLGLLEPKK